MDERSINSLREALKFSPDNIALRQHFAEILLEAGRMDEAIREFTELVKLRPDTPSRLALARAFFTKGDFATCNVILEAMISEEHREGGIFLLHAKALLKENNLGDAISAYKKALELDPKLQDEELDKELRIPTTLARQDEDDDLFTEAESGWIEKPDTRFNDVGGMDSVKKEISLKIIRPLQHPELYKAYGKKTGGGILLYGPPGCGKTFLARATAGEVSARFINVRLNDILDMWIGSSEKNLHELFELARRNTPCVLFIDEIDALGASRSDMKQSSGRHLINQFLQELDGIENNNEGILILGATNAPWHLDPAFRRPGRFDRIIFVPPPDEAAREGILRLKLEGRPAEEIDYRQLARKMEHYSGADIEAVIDIAIEQKLEAAFDDGVPKPISTNDLLQAARKHRPSTQEWFGAAKNFALFANDSGLYDDILTHLKIKK